MRRALAAAGIVLAAAAAGRTLGADAPGDAVLAVGRFSAMAPGQPLSAPWQPLTFSRIERHTRYELVADDEARVVVRATADAAASGLIRRIRVDPNEYPILQWRWKVANVVEQGDVTRKAGDDYPARIYVTFDYEPDRVGLVDAARYRAARALFGADTPYRALNYIWERKAPRGSVVPNPYTDWAMMVVVRSGTGDVGRWVTEARNIAEDYRKAFGTDPPPISGIAIMTDTDNTQSSATAWYGDIVLRRAAGP